MDKSATNLESHPDTQGNHPRDVTVLKRHVRSKLAAEHPFRIAVEALPDTISQDEFLVHLRILLPLARLEGA
jgi:hypothetical protein